MPVPLTRSTIVGCNSVSNKTCSNLFQLVPTCLLRQTQSSAQHRLLAEDKNSLEWKHGLLGPARQAEELNFKYPVEDFAKISLNQKAES